MSQKSSWLPWLEPLGSEYHVRDGTFFPCGLFVWGVGRAGCGSVALGLRMVPGGTLDGLGLRVGWGDGSVRCVGVGGS